MKRALLLLLLLLCIAAAAFADSTPRPADVETLYETGLVAKRAHDYPRAIASLTAALEADPDHVDCHWVLAWVYADEDKPDLAQEHFEAVIRLAADSDRARQATGAIARLGFPSTTTAAPAEVPPVPAAAATAAPTAGDAAKAADEAQASPASEVYISWGTGDQPSYYHRDNCRHCGRLRTPAMLQFAQNTGCKPCQHCRPDLAEAPDRAAWWYQPAAPATRTPTRTTSTTTLRELWVGKGPFYDEKGVAWGYLNGRWYVWCGPSYDHIVEDDGRHKRGRHRRDGAHARDRHDGGRHDGDHRHDRRGW